MKFAYDDGGRQKAGFQGKTDDCVCRAIAIATGKPYGEVYDALNRAAVSERPGAAKRRGGKRSNARTGMFAPTVRRYLESIGWRWVPTMFIGSGCKVHLRSDELPAGRLIVNVSRHYCAVIDGVLRDNHDCTRGGTRCVCGYFVEG